MADSHIMKIRSTIAATFLACLADKKQGPFELRVDWIRIYGGGTLSDRS